MYLVAINVLGYVYNHQVTLRYYSTGCVIQYALHVYLITSIVLSISHFPDQAVYGHIFSGILFEVQTFSCLKVQYCRDLMAGSPEIITYPAVSS